VLARAAVAALFSTLVYVWPTIVIGAVVDRNEIGSETTNGDLDIFPVWSGCWSGNYRNLIEGKTCEMLSCEIKAIPVHSRTPNPEKLLAGYDLFQLCSGNNKLIAEKLPMRASERLDAGITLGWDKPKCDRILRRRNYLAVAVNKQLSARGIAGILPCGRYKAAALVASNDHLQRKNKSTLSNPRISHLSRNQIPCRNSGNDAYKRRDEKKPSIFGHFPSRDSYQMFVGSLLLLLSGPFAFRVPEMLDKRPKRYPDYAKIIGYTMTALIFDSFGVTLIFRLWSF
jgi:hypothetical protein